MEKRVKSIIGLACVAAVTLAMATTGRANLLVDPGFEQGLTAPNPPTANAQGWSLFNGASFLTTGLAHGGTNVMSEITNNNVPGAFQADAASPGQNFTMTGFCLVPQGLASGTSFGILQLTYFDGPNGTGNNIGTVQTSPGNAFSSAQVNQSSPINTWIPLTVTATAPAGAQSVEAFCLTVDFTGATEGYYFDDTSLVLVPEPSSIALVLTGLGGLVMLARKRRS